MIKQAVSLLNKSKFSVQNSSFSYYIIYTQHLFIELYSFITYIHTIMKLMYLYDTVKSFVLAGVWYKTTNV